MESSSSFDIAKLLTHYAEWRQINLDNLQMR